MEDKTPPQVSVVDQQPVSEPALSPSPKNPASGPNKKMLMIITGIVVLILIVSAGGIFAMNMSKKNAVVQEVPSPTIAVESPTSTPIASPTADLSPTSSKLQILPMTLNGSAQIKAGQIAPAGTTVEALIDEIVCGSTTTRETSTLSPNFTLEIKSTSQKAGCGEVGSSMSFKINGEKAMQNMPFNSDVYSGNAILNVSY